MNELFVHCMHDWRQLCSRIPETGPGLRGGCRRVLLKEAAPSMGNHPTDVTDRRYRQRLVFSSTERDDYVSTLYIVRPRRVPILGCVLSCNEVRAHSVAVSVC